MEVSGVVSRQVPCFSGAGIDTTRSSTASFHGEFRVQGRRDFGVSLRTKRFRGQSNYGFCDDGHVQYYHVGPRCGCKKEKEIKKKLKLLKGLSKDLSASSQMGFGPLDSQKGLVAQFQGKLISEGAEALLLKQLEQLRAEEKELKRKRKEEKAMLKAERMKNMVDSESSSSSSSESSESECGELVDMNRLRSEAPAKPILDSLQPFNHQEGAVLTLPSSLAIATHQENTTVEHVTEFGISQNQEAECCSGTSTSCVSSSGSIGHNDALSSSVMGASALKIEVCMGNKCKKSGGGALLEEFEPLLKMLSLQGMHGVKSFGTEFYGDGTDIWFPSLEELSISDFANLEEWSSANDGNAFHRLKKLTVKSCPKLAHIPLPQSLQHLELRDCNPTMVSIADLSLLSVVILDKIPDLVSLPKRLFASASLSSLEILSCPKLHSMPLEMQNLSSLKSLTIRWCEELSSLPQSLQNLKALESLEISDCHSLTSLPNCGIAGLVSLRTLSIENCSELTSLSSSLEQLTLLEHLTIMYCPKLGYFPTGVQHLSSLRSLIVLSCPWFDSLPEGLENVKTLHCLEISSCPNLTALPEWFEDLVSLRSLTIYDCPNLKLLPPSFKLLTKLQHLSIQECPELEERCRRGSGEDWWKIANVPHKYIGSPQVRQSGDASTSGSSSVQASSQ